MSDDVIAFRVKCLLNRVESKIDVVFNAFNASNDVGETWKWKEYLENDDEQAGEVILIITAVKEKSIKYLELCG